MNYLVGMTGGIGSGKSAAAGIFQELGAGLIDTDDVARYLTEPGQPALLEIQQQLGAEMVTAAGLDRARLRDKVFADPAARKTLEGILHPKIHAQTLHLLRDTIAPYTILVVPLLFETGTYLPLLKRIVVVDCDPATQVQRVMARSNISQAQAEAIVAAQISRDKRVSYADDIIRNDQDFDALHRQVEALHALYLTHPAPRAR